MTIKQAIKDWTTREISEHLHVHETESIIIVGATSCMYMYICYMYSSEAYFA